MPLPIKYRASRREGQSLLGRGEDGGADEMPAVLKRFEIYFKAGKGEKIMMLPKDLLSDLEKGDRTIEMLKIDSVGTTITVPGNFNGGFLVGTSQQSWISAQQQLAGNIVFNTRGEAIWR